MKISKFLNLLLRRYEFMNFGYSRPYYSGWDGEIKPKIFSERFYIKTNILDEFSVQSVKCGFHHLMRRGSFNFLAQFERQIYKEQTQILRPPPPAFRPDLGVVKRRNEAEKSKPPISIFINLQTKFQLTSSIWRRNGEGTALFQGQKGENVDISLPYWPRRLIFEYVRQL